MNHVTIRHNGKTYPARELIMPSGAMWLVSSAAVEQTAPEEVDGMIGFYVPQDVFLTGSDSELITLIEEAM